MLAGPESYVACGAIWGATSSSISNTRGSRSSKVSQHFLNLSASTTIKMSVSLRHFGAFYEVVRKKCELSIVRIALVISIKCNGPVQLLSDHITHLCQSFPLVNLKVILSEFHRFVEISSNVFVVCRRSNFKTSTSRLSGSRSSRSLRAH